MDSFFEDGIEESDSADLGMMGTEEVDDVFLFPELCRYQDGCRFSGCLHDQEPDCAIKQKVQSGEVDAGRYRSYQATLEELRQAQKTASARGRRYR